MTDTAALVVADLERHLDVRCIVSDPEVVTGFAVDWTRRFRGSPACVVRAHSRDDVVTLMERSAALGFPVVAQGGNTGLVGATMAPPGSVILNLGSLSAVVDDGDGSSLVAGAGATVASVQEAAARRGRVFGLDLASRDSATVGGAFATNAGGIYASYWGRMQDQVIGVEAVMADGQVQSTIDVADSSPSAADLVDVLAGSEGALAVVTALRLRLREPLGQTTVVLAGFDSIEVAGQAAVGTPGLIAAELFGQAEMDLVIEHNGLARPMEPHPWYLLVELESGSIEGMDFGGEAVVGPSLWSYRERITESIATLGVIHKLDVVVPPSRLGALHMDLSERLTPNRLFVFGHLLQSNIHLNVAPADPAATVADDIDQVVLDAVEAAGGDAAGEHGVGRAKAARVRNSMPDGLRDIADGVKRAFDPDNRLNPGVGPGRP